MFNINIWEFINSPIVLFLVPAIVLFIAKWIHKFITKLNHHDEKLQRLNDQAKMFKLEIENLKKSLLDTNNDLSNDITDNGNKIDQMNELVCSLRDSINNLQKILDEKYSKKLEEERLRIDNLEQTTSQITATISHASVNRLLQSFKYFIGQGAVSVDEKQRLINLYNDIQQSSKDISPGELTILHNLYKEFVNLPN